MDRKGGKGGLERAMGKVDEKKREGIIGGGRDRERPRGVCK